MNQIADSQEFGFHHAKLVHKGHALFEKKIKSVKGSEILLNEESYYTFFFAS
jgi:hypothetical protein